MNLIKSYLTIRDVTYELPSGETLFENISFTVNNNRYGLVGDNGVGKTTLVKIIAKQISVTSGEIICDGEVVLLAQDEQQSNYDISVTEYLSDLWESLFADPKIWGPLIEEINMESKVSQLSGGEWTRIRIAKHLANPCQLLILDEPTNNLDTEAKNKIEDFVRNYFQSPLLIISHDRQILNAVDHILELTNQGISSYGGNFDFYYAEKIEERQRQELQLETLKKQKKKVEEEWIRKNISQEKRMRTGAKNSDSIPRILAGLRKRQAENTMSKIQKKEKARFDKSQQEIGDAYNKLKLDKTMRLDIPPVEVPNGKKIFSIQNANIQFKGQSPLWAENLNYILHGPKRVALRGSNGTGKSSLVKALLGLFKSEDRVDVTGELSLGQIKAYVLDQNYSLLDPTKTVLENIMEETKLTIDEVRNQLALMQFEKEKVFQNIQTLSGGEKLKASLAKIFLSNPAPEFLILDEPTNNLDLGSLAILEECLQEYKGALLVISHDEVFLDKIQIEDYIQLKRS